MKIDIITLHNINNYGSVLQTFATQEVFKTLGYETEVIDYWRENTLPEKTAKRILEKSLRLKKIDFIWKNSEVIQKLIIKLISMRIKCHQTPMSRFIKENINLTPKRYTSLNQLKKDLPEADIYVTGSDQVWNSSYNGGIDRAYYLDFAPKDKMKISLAASIGKTNISIDEEESIKPMLEQYQSISVRESSAIELLKRIGIDSTLILDPTLLLSGQEWLKLDEKKPICNEPYLLIYQLNSNNKMDEYAERMAQKMHLKLIRFGFNHSDKSKTGYCIMHPSVQDFINLFSNAQCVLTDSFHATVFSLNLGTDFISILPPRFGTRIESVLKLTKTQNRLLTDYNDFSIINNNIDKAKVQGILDNKRKEDIEWLKSALAKVKES